MRINNPNLKQNLRIVDISKKAEMYSLILISMAMIVLTINFYLADAVYLKASVLPFYILFFVLMFVACMVVEYMTLWCERDHNFHCTRVVVHGLALVLVTYEMGAFYSSDQSVYSHLPTYSFTSALSHIVITPPALNNVGI